MRSLLPARLIFKVVASVIHIVVKQRILDCVDGKKNVCERSKRDDVAKLPSEGSVHEEQAWQRFQSPSATNS